ncbi:MAG: hypothetical protein RSC87_09820 [Muribaculaceae bacterium]
MAVDVKSLQDNGVKFYPQTIGQAVYVEGENKTLDVVINELKARDVTVDTSLNATSGNPIANKAVKVELDKKLNTADFNAKVGSSGGICPLDSNSKVPASHLPGYVDDVIELFSMGKALDEDHLMPLMVGKAYAPDTKKINTYVGAIPNIVLESSANPEADKIYINKSTNKIYRWSGTDMVVISETIALGETSSTAYAGNKGKANATAIAGLTTRMGTTETRLDTAEAGIVAGQQNLSQLSSIVSGNTSGISALQGSLNTEKGKISTLQNQMGTANSNISNLSSSVQSLNSGLGTANNNIASITSRVATIESKYVSATKVGSKVYNEIPAGAFA